MSLEANRHIVRRLVEEAYNQGQMAAAGELLAPGFVGHSPVGETFGREEWKQGVLMLRTTFPDYRLTIDDLIAEGDRVVWRWTMHGTDRGGLAGRPPTGRTATMYGINIERIEDGQIVESWTASDHTPMLQALGILGE
ncbi:MAG: ester cyclase [Rhodothermales bacterium]|nr:ester cyclase [Rhodothermales bacterium]